MTSDLLRKGDKVLLITGRRVALSEGARILVPAESRGTVMEDERRKDAGGQGGSLLITTGKPGEARWGPQSHERAVWVAFDEVLKDLRLVLEIYCAVDGLRVLSDLELLAEVGDEI